MHYLYIITNILSNKIYIGQTKYPERRWRQHKNLSNKKIKHQYIHYAMYKYGLENFTYEIIAQSITQEDADITEIDLIKQYDSCNPEIGYNFRSGGHVFERSMKTRKLISESLKGRSSPRKGVVLSDEQKMKMSIIAKNLGLKPPNLKNRKLSDEHKKKLSDAKIINPIWNKGIQLTDEHKKNISKAKIKNTLSDDQILNIQNDIRSSRIVAENYGVSQSTIIRIRNKK